MEHTQPEWRQRLDDPAEPLFTMGVVSELLGADPQTLRRFDQAEFMVAARPSGNQRRYSRDDIAVLAYALTLADDGMPLDAISRIIALEQRVAELEQPD